jgi:CRISPR-associated protein Csb3
MIEVKLNPSNPGEVLACLGLFEIAQLHDMCYAGFKEERGEVWFELQSNTSLLDLLQYVKNARIEEVSREEFQGDAKLEFKEEEWSKWCPVKIKFPSSREIILKWWLNPLFQKERKSALKSWSGQEVLVWKQTKEGKKPGFLRELQEKIDINRSLSDFFYRVSSLSIGFDACGTWDPSMVGYSYNTIKNSTLDRRRKSEKNPHVSPLCEFLSFIALRSFRPREIKEGDKEKIKYYLWKVILPHNVARLAFIGAVDRGYLLSGWQAEVISRGQGGYSSLSFANSIFP